MKISYKKPECELLPVYPERVLCLSGNASLDQLTTDTVDGGDYEQIY